MTKPSWDQIPRLPARELREIQNARLRAFLGEQIYPFSPFYRGLFDKNHIDPRKIRTVEDLRHVPFTSKKDLLPTPEAPTQFRDFILQPDREKIAKFWPLSKKLPLLLAGADGAKRRLEREYYPIFVTFTTGRSAAPVSFLYTQHDLGVLRESGKRILDVAGLDIRARAVNLFPFAPHLAFWQVSFAGFEAGMFILGTGGGKVLGTAGNIRAMERVQAEIVMGVPGFVYHCLREARETGVKLPSIRTVILGAEKIPAGMREKMAEILVGMGSPGVKIFGTYGFTEARMAWVECPTPEGQSSGYHLYPDLCLFEVVDPKTGEPKKEGEDGELVFSTLAGRGSCVLRYRTGDLVQGGIRWDPCPFCRRTVPRISSSLSRASNQTGLNLTKIKGTLVSLDELAAILGSIKEVEEWQVELRKANDDPLGLDQLVVRIALAPDADQGQVSRLIKDKMVSTVELSPNLIEILPLKEMLELLGMESEMKEKRFLDRRPKG